MQDTSQSGLVYNQCIKKGQCAYVLNEPLHFTQYVILALFDILIPYGKFKLPNLIVILIVVQVRFNGCSLNSILAA